MKKKILKFAKITSEAMEKVTPIAVIGLWGIALSPIESIIGRIIAIMIAGVLLFCWVVNMYQEDRRL